jgi:electron transport complex protein RnfB
MKRPTVAFIDEPRCIGCTRCIDACPVDAIVGAQGLMHTVVESWCIGCDLCVPACPVDCIGIVPARGPWTEAHKRAAGERAKRRQARVVSERIVPFTGDRKALIASLLERKRRA